MSQVFSIREAAEYLGIGYGSMCALVRDGKLATVQILKRKKLTKAALDAFIEASTCGPIGGPTEISHPMETPVDKGRLTVAPKLSKDAPYAWTQRYAAK